MLLRCGNCRMVGCLASVLSVSSLMLASRTNDRLGRIRTVQVSALYTAGGTCSNCESQARRKHLTLGMRDAGGCKQLRDHVDRSYCGRIRHRVCSIYVPDTVLLIDESVRVLSMTVPLYNVSTAFTLISFRSPHASSPRPRLLLLRTVALWWG